MLQSDRRNADGDQAADVIHKVFWVTGRDLSGGDPIGPAELLGEGSAMTLDGERDRFAVASALEHLDGLTCLLGADDGLTDM